MNNIIMQTRSELSESSLLEAIRQIRDAEKPRSVVGHDEAQFYEVEIAPSADELVNARAVVDRLNNAGIGLKVTINWAFDRTTRWAVKTANTRLVNHGV